MIMTATRSLARKAGGVPSICSYGGCWKIEDDIKRDIDGPLASMSTQLLRPAHKKARSYMHMQLRGDISLTPSGSQL
jgi:hypothetical protein